MDMRGATEAMATEEGATEATGRGETVATAESGLALDKRAATAAVVASDNWLIGLPAPRKLSTTPRGWGVVGYGLADAPERIGVWV